MENPEFTPLLPTHDWAQEWRDLQVFRRRADNADYWNERAKTYATKSGPSEYALEFIRLMDARPGETVFDMGCGTGSLAIPLAKAGHPVLAGDFSEGMLRELKAGIQLEGAPAELIRITQMSWADDWSTQGITSDCADIAIASRSIVTEDLRDSLLRLTDVARRRVCITLPTGASPHMDEKALRTAGVPLTTPHDYAYAFQILVQEGINPEINYIDSARADTFNSAEDAWAKYRKMLVSALPKTDPQFTCIEARLHEWLHEQLVPNPEAGQPDNKGIPQGALTMREPRHISWAFLAWNK